MLLTEIHHSPRVRRMLLGAGIPVIEVWDLTDTPIDMCVGFSHAVAGRAVADFAYDAGYRVAATITVADERARPRATAFVERFAARGGKMSDGFNLPGPASLAEGRRGLCELWDNQGFAGGVVFCSSDLLAHGAVIEAQKRELHIPETVAIIGFGDQDFAAHTEPALTTVSVDRTALSGAAAKALLVNINGDERMPRVEILASQFTDGRPRKVDFSPASHPAPASGANPQAPIVTFARLKERYHVLVRLSNAAKFTP